MRTKDQCDWTPYADFEREKLKELLGTFSLSRPDGFSLYIKREGRKQFFYMCDEETGYGYAFWRDDSESNRLLKRAEFLKAVCGKEGVEWLPTPAHLKMGTLWAGEDENSLKEIGKITNIDISMRRLTAPER